MNGVSLSNQVIHWNPKKFAVKQNFNKVIKENEKVFSGMLFGVYDGVHFISELPASAAVAASSIGFILDSGASSDSMRENIV